VGAALSGPAASPSPPSRPRAPCVPTGATDVGMAPLAARSRANATRRNPWHDTGLGISNDEGLQIGHQRSLGRVARWRNMRGRPRMRA